MTQSQAASVRVTHKSQAPWVELTAVEIGVRNQRLGRGFPLLMVLSASQKNSSQARDILAAVSQTLSKSPVDFWGAKILAGQDEGAFGWITINYVLGMLLKVQG